MPPQLVLASASPRRFEILTRVTSRFTVEVADIDEQVHTGESPAAYVRRLAEGKAREVARPGTVVIGADTSVVLDEEILGKPADRDDARDTLRRLRARAHHVISGVAVIATAADGTERVAIGHEVSEVHVDVLSDARIEWYVATGEPDDKAGSYGLQGSGGLFADRVSGSVSNVIGLPMGLLDALVTEVGHDLVATEWSTS
ncbi:MAG: Maf family protein [Actinomycetota bacterium]